jgi:hypothetical protein
MRLRTAHNILVKESEVKGLLCEIYMKIILKLSLNK